MTYSTIKTLGLLVVIQLSLAVSPVFGSDENEEDSCQTVLSGNGVSQPEDPNEVGKRPLNEYILSGNDLKNILHPTSLPEFPVHVILFRHLRDMKWRLEQWMSDKNVHDFVRQRQRVGTGFGIRAQGLGIFWNIMSQEPEPEEEHFFRLVYYKTDSQGASLVHRLLRQFDELKAAHPNAEVDVYVAQIIKRLQEVAQLERENKALPHESPEQVYYTLAKFTSTVRTLMKMVHETSDQVPDTELTSIKSFFSTHRIEYLMVTPDPRSALVLQKRAPGLLGAYTRDTIVANEWLLEQWFSAMDIEEAQKKINGTYLTPQYELSISNSNNEPQNHPGPLQPHEISEDGKPLVPHILNRAHRLPGRNIQKNGQVIGRVSSLFATGALRLTPHEPEDVKRAKRAKDLPFNTVNEALIASDSPGAPQLDNEELLH